MVVGKTGTEGVRKLSFVSSIFQFSGHRQPLGHCDTQGQGSKPVDTRLSHHFFQCWDGAGKLGGGHVVLKLLPLSRPVPGEKQKHVPPTLSVSLNELCSF